MATASSSVRKILVIGPAWVGDMVMAQPLFATLKSIHPGCIIDVVAPRATFPLLARMAEVRRGILLDLKHGELGLSRRFGMGVALREEGYDQAIVLPNSFKSALLPLFARIPQRTGWRGEFRFGVLNDLRVLDPDLLPLMVDRFRGLASGVRSRDCLLYTSPSPRDS